MPLIKDRQLIVHDLGLIDYETTFLLQKKIVHDVINGADECLILCEHPPVITLGRLARAENIFLSEASLADRQIKKVHVDRGGDVYPILDLSRHTQDLHVYIRQIEQVAIDLLADFGILTFRNSGYTGVWTGSKKIVSIGIAVKKWVAYHGFAVNLDIDLDLFALIRPCGLDVEITSVREILKEDINAIDFKRALIDKVSRIFNFSTIERDRLCPNRP